MPFTPVGTHQVYYDEYGTGRPLVLIPGLATSRLCWSKQIESFSQKHRLIALDNRGAGDCVRAEGPFTITTMADDAAGVIRNLHLGPTSLVGWSMGGFIAQELTLRHPGLVDKLILVSTSAGGSSHIPASAEILALLPPIENEDIEARIRRIYPLLTGQGYLQTHPQDLTLMVEQALAKPMTMESYLQQLNAVITWGGSGNRLAQITSPTLIIHGEADPLIPYANGLYLAEHLKGARLLTYSGVGHLPPIEATADFNRAVMGFLK